MDDVLRAGYERGAHGIGCSPQRMPSATRKDSPRVTPPTHCQLVDMGSLSSAVKRFGCLNERLVAIYTSQILSGLEFLDRNGVVHRDLKAANILLSKKGVVKLSDFGTAALFGAPHPAGASSSGGGGGVGASGGGAMVSTPVLLPPPMRAAFGSTALEGLSRRRKKPGAAALQAPTAFSGAMTPGAGELAGTPYWLAPELIEVRGRQQQGAHSCALES